MNFRATCHNATSVNLQGQSLLTDFKGAPGYRRRGVAGKDVMDGMEGGLKGGSDGLPPALAPHVNFASLGAGCWCVVIVCGCYLHKPGQHIYKGVLLHKDDTPINASFNKFSSMLKTKWHHISRCRNVVVYYFSINEFPSCLSVARLFFLSV